MCAIHVALVLKRLPEAQRDLLDDKYLLNLPVRAMAEQRGMGEKAVESALTRAREAFRQAFETCKRQEFIR